MESASKLIDVVGRIHSLVAIGPRSVSGNLSELAKATCIPHPDSPSIFNPEMAHGILLTLGVSLTSSALSPGLHSEKVFCCKDS